MNNRPHSRQEAGLTGSELVSLPRGCEFKGVRIILFFRCGKISTSRLSFHNTTEKKFYNCVCLLLATNQNNNSFLTKRTQRVRKIMYNKMLKCLLRNWQKIFHTKVIFSRNSSLNPLIELSLCSLSVETSCTFPHYWILLSIKICKYSVVLITSSTQISSSKTLLLSHPKNSF